MLRQCHDNNNESNSLGHPGIKSPMEPRLATSACAPQKEPPCELKLESDAGVVHELTSDNKLKLALQLLVRAYRFADECQRDAWEFAVEVEQMQARGISNSELRWLVGQQLSIHAQEVAGSESNNRVFSTDHGFTISPSSCFVLTDRGVQLADELQLDNGDEAAGPEMVRPRPDENELRQVQPEFDSDRNELKLGEYVVKRFKWPAANQIMVLSAFQEDGWPARIDDPLPPAAEIDPKRRLSDTIKSLNRKQKHTLLRFSGDGTGEGILWEMAIDGF